MPTDLSGFKDIFTGGEESEKLIKSGTLFVTRGSGALAIGLIGLFIALDQLDTGPWRNLDSQQKLRFVVSVGLIWSIVAAGDAIARGISSGIASSKDLVILDPPIDAIYEPATGARVEAKVRAIRSNPDGTIKSYLITMKDGDTKWQSDKVKLGK